MKVAFITHYAELYGANRSLLNLIDGLRKYEVSSYVFSPKEGALTKILREKNIPVSITPMRLWMSESPESCGNFLKLAYRYIRWYYHSFRRLYFNFSTLPVIVRQIKKWNVDLIYTNSSVILIGALASKWLHLPHIWHIREFGKLDYNIQCDWGDSIFRHSIGSADAIIAVSNAISTHLLGNITNKHIHVIYNGVLSADDFDRLYNLARAKRINSLPYTFALVGVISKNKGQETAIKALAIVAQSYPNVRLLIVGGGDVNSLKQMADELGIAGKVDFWGYIQDPYTAYLAADAVLMCSKYEAMGRVTVEAMSACRPVIGYNGAGTSELIEHEYIGLLYNDGPEELAVCMMRVIENPDWARKLGERGWHIARNKYSIEVYAESIYRILRSSLT